MLATLSSLRIRHLALVEELTWPLAPGFTAVTGETGSGKSIIVGALKLILGERADKSLIRAGAESCSVEATFEVPVPAKLNALLEEHGVDPCEEGQLLVKRVFTAAGSNKQFVNGSPATLAVLKKLGDELVDLHGPHDHQSLLSPETQLELIDAYAGAANARQKYEEVYRHLTALRAERDALAADEASLERELDLLRHQVTEIEAAGLQAGEEGEVTRRYQLAANSQKLAGLSAHLLDALAEGEGAALPQLAQVGKLLRDLERVDPAAVKWAEAQARAVAELEDLAAELQSYRDELELDPQSFSALEDRVSLLETLKRKYGGSLEAVMEFGAQASARLQKIEGRGDELERLEKELAAGQKELLAAGEALGKLRKAGAPKLAKEATAHLRDLGFKKAEFTATLPAQPVPGPHGLETAEFVFAPNPGEPPKPLRAIASSGEISRVMLALKSALATHDTVSLLVFDEIDANVGGEIAHAVGAKMRSLGERHQVLCISHLPQVAAQAQAQYVVTKEYRDERTHSQLRHVEGAAREEEIARMLGGKGASALAHARTLLEGGE